MSRPKTRAYIKQETEDSKESLKRALYSPVKIEPPSLEISKCKSTPSRRTKKRHCSLCNITFNSEKVFLQHELHIHLTKETPIIDLETFCCNICNKSYSCIETYRLHMAKLNNVHIPSRGMSKLDPSKTPDVEDPNNYCLSCNYTYKTPFLYRTHLILTHGMSYLRSTRKSRKPKDTTLKIDMLKMDCSACKKTFINKGNYIHHLVKVHKITLPEIYSEPNNFDMESRYCKVCDRTFSCRTSYLNHLTTFHLDEMPELYQGVDFKNSKRVKSARSCVKCEKILLSKCLYQIHLDKIHGIKVRSLPSADEPDVNRLDNYCTSCKKTYSGTYNFQQHMIDIHRLIIPSKLQRQNTVNNIAPIMDLDKKYCNVCDKIYGLPNSYKIHMLKYHNIKFPSTELSHIVNRKEIPVIDQTNNHCTACNKVYKRRDTYSSHLYKVHSMLLPKQKRKVLSPNNPDIIPDMDDKNNHCASCDKTYACKYYYKSHLTRIHNMKGKKNTIKEECK